MTDLVFPAKVAGLDVSRETLRRFEIFEALFHKWSKAINLVAPSTKHEFRQRHVADSAQIFKLLPEAKQWVDLGSGGGFPGIITAILLTELGEGWVHLVESNHKKAGFLRQALLETRARGTVHACRIEDAAERIPDCDAISARALADLDLLLELSHPWALRNAKLRSYFHKGRDYQAEVEKARGRWSFGMVIHQSAIEHDSVILEITDIAPKLQP